MNETTQTTPQPSYEQLAAQNIQLKRRCAEQKKHLKSLNAALQNKYIHISNLIYQREMWRNRAEQRQEVLDRIQQPWYRRVFNWK